MLQATDSCCARWTSTSRYYRAVVQQNLFGQWELVRSWGGLGTRLGGMLIYPATNREDALARLAEEAQRRRKRGYRRA